MTLGLVRRLAMLGCSPAAAAETFAEFAVPTEKAAVFHANKIGRLKP